jgi:beta-lactamase class A
MKKIFIAILIGLPFFATAQKTDKKLQTTLQETIRGFQGDIGIYVKNLRTGKKVSINADTIFPTASIVKVPILIGIIDRMNRGELKYDSALIYKDSLLYEGEDILGSFKDNEKIALKKVLMLMLTTSDNTASLWLQSIAGTGTRINELLEGLGLKYTRVNSRTPGRETNRIQYGWGQTTPAEMAGLFEMIYNNKIISAAACERMQRLLGRNFWDGEGLSQIPPSVEVYSKNGAVNASRSEVMIVNACHNPYIFSIFTKNNKDISWEDNNEAWELTRKISKILWEYYGKK